MTMPNFLVIGASKAGTTSLHQYLGQHSEIYMAEGKETYFFNFEGDDSKFDGPGDEERLNRRVVRTREEYQARFAGVTNQKAIGEVCGPYLYDPKAAERIKHHIPDAKLIAVLRHPVERAYSAYMQVIREGQEPIFDFAAALELEQERIRKNWRYMWHFTSIGFYCDQVKRYMDLFDPSQIRIFLYEEDYLEKPLVMLGDTFRFLGVEDGFVPDMTVRHNVTGIPRNRGLWKFTAKPNLAKKVIKSFVPQKLRQRLRAAETKLNLQKPPLAPELKQKLISYFRDDILKLQDLIGRDLSRWLS